VAAHLSKLFPVFEKKHRLHRGLHMQQSHASRNGCCLVAVMASSNACAVRPRQSRTTTSVESASMSQHQRSTVEREHEHEARSMTHEASPTSQSSIPRSHDRSLMSGLSLMPWSLGTILADMHLLPTPGALAVRPPAPARSLPTKYPADSCCCMATLLLPCSWPLVPGRFPVACLPG
jgi:hypothetical protein